MTPPKPSKTRKERELERSAAADRGWPLLLEFVEMMLADIEVLWRVRRAVNERTGGSGGVHPDPLIDVVARGVRARLGDGSGLSAMRSLEKLDVATLKEIEKAAKAQVQGWLDEFFAPRSKLGKRYRDQAAQFAAAAYEMLRGPTAEAHGKREALDRDTRREAIADMIDESTRNVDRRLSGAAWKRGFAPDVDPRLYALAKPAKATTRKRRKK